MDGVRRSARLRGIAAALEDSEKSGGQKQGSSESFRGKEPHAQMNPTDPIEHGPSPELADRTGASCHLDSHLDIAHPRKCAVVLNRMEFEDDYHSDDGEKKEKERGEDGEKDELHKAAKHSSSRIPTFQSSASRRRPTSQGPDTLAIAQDKGDGSNPLIQPRGIGKGTAGGDMSRVRVPRGKDTALPLPLTRLPIGDVADMSGGQHQPGASLPHTGPKEPLGYPLDADTFAHKTSIFKSLESTANGSDSHQQQPLGLTPRPALRADPAPCDPESMLVPAQELPVKVEAKPAGLSFVEPVAANGEIEDGSSATQVCEQGTRQAVNRGIGWDEGRGRPAFDPSLTGSEACAGDVSVESEPVEPQSEKVPAKEKSLGHRLDASVMGSELRASREKPVSRKGTKRSQELLRNTAERPVLSQQSGSVGGSTSRPPPRTCSVCCWLMLSSTLVLLGGLGLHLWRYGTPASVSELLEQVDLDWLETLWGSRLPCGSECSFSLVESLPEGVHFDPGSPVLPQISQAWLNLLGRANRSVSIAAFYFTLRASDLGPRDPSAAEGEQVFKQLMQLESRGVKLQVAVNSPQTFPQDTDDLSNTGAEVRRVDLQNATGGIIHTKLWAVDETHFYMGSANMDWRSLTQVKEVAVMVENCSCLAEDASRLFRVYWYLGAEGGQPVPHLWPARYSALSSAQHPLLVKLNGVPAHVYFSSSPPPLAAYGRTDDLSAILSVIYDAQKFVYVSVMDYLPFTEFTQPERFWPAIDSALRDVACSRGVEVNLLVSCWAHSHGSMFVFLKSLAVLHEEPLGCNVRVRVFVVPSTVEQSHIPFARVNHAKFMVTDRAAYIGTSNWSENYFTHTAGVGLVVNQTGLDRGQGQRSVQSQLTDVFMRDWTSSYSRTLSDVLAQGCNK